MKGTLAKRIRQKSAIERLEDTVTKYQNKMASTKDEEQLKSLEKKVKIHRSAIENTKKKLK